MPLAVLAVLAASWAGLWAYAAGEANARLDAQLEKEKAQGRIWTCPGRAAGGFPLALRISCDAPTLEASAEGRKTLVKLAGLSAGWSILQPFSATASLTAPMEISNQAGGPAARVEWSRFDIALQGLPGEVTGLEGQIGQPSVTAAQPSGEPAPAKAERIALTIAPAAGRPPQERVFTVKLDVARLTAPPVDKAMKSGDPLDLSLEANVTHAPAGGQNLRERLEAWRAVGGAIELTRLDLGKGATKANGSGALSLDAAHRPQGDLAFAVSGFETLAAAFGAPPAAAKLTGVLGGLLPGAKPAGPKADAGAVRAQVQLRDGRVYYGPLQLPVVLPPLY